MNRSLLVCIAPGNKESWELIGAFLANMGFRAGEWKLCGDLKVMNLCVGIMTHSSRFPCHMCEWEAGKQDDDAPTRTLENIKLNNDAWMAAGAVQSELKKFKNCRHPPLSLFPSTGAVEEWVSRSDLHLEL